LTLVVDDSNVRILDGTIEVARHARSWGKGQQIESEDHIAALAAEKSRAHELRGRDRLFSAAPKARAFLERIATHGGHLGGTTHRLLRLGDQYGMRELDEAIGIAIENTSYAAKSVAFILEQRRRAAETTVPVPVALPNDPRVRDLVVAPRPLSAFDVLAADDEEAGS
ncbi:MAG: IS21 family transposase, partial [candidate division Zixibacteria bacterium]|nr:IS21 family transposase [candidate division Zixibacteria bacterium]